MLRVRDAGARLAVDRLQAQQPHQPPHPVPTDGHPLTRQMAYHLPSAVERVLQVQLIDAPHQRQVRRALADRRVVQRRAAQSKQGALPAQAQVLVVTFNHLPSFVPSQSLSPRAKKSRSTVNSPMFACNSWMVAS